MTAPAPLFVLTCMRSYSSLVSSMLGQHPGLYCLPEVNPFIAPTLGASVDLLQMVRKRTLDGLYRAVAEIEFGAQTEQAVARARRWVAERRDWSATDLMGWFAEAAAPARLVEKSPSTVLRPDRLATALETFPEARILHLYRHPVSTSSSIAKITGAGLPGLFGKARASAARDPEESWYATNAAIVRAGAALERGRFMSIRGEDLLGDPDHYLAQICEWLDLPAGAEEIAAMKRPDQSPYASLGPASAPFGNDPNFLRDPTYTKRPITLPPLDAELDWAAPGRRLAPRTVALARQLGYGAQGHRT